ncbi:MAG TPA: helix-turn-helix transcriptional regulator [Anaerovoracaceae bacterium]|nr:helix-turn-helix transcriptional regulator [Anaerovoracaceae bacterium]
MPFGQVIAEARKKAGLSQKDLASRVKKEDGSPISPQYLNDIERDRRNPPSDFILSQFAKELNLSIDYLVVIAGKVPDDINIENYQPEEIEAAIRAFRRTLRKRDNEMDS